MPWCPLELVSKQLGVQLYQCTVLVYWCLTDLVSNQLGVQLTWYPINPQKTTIVGGGIRNNLVIPRNPHGGGEVTLWEILNKFKTP